MKLFIYLFFILFILSGCVSSGNQTLKTESEASITTKIVENVTTQAEIKAMFGSPYETKFTDGGLEIYTYRLDDLQSDAINYVPFVNLFVTSYSGTRKELVVLFNENGTVKRFSMSESDVQTKSGLVN